MKVKILLFLIVFGIYHSCCAQVIVQSLQNGMQWEIRNGKLGIVIPDPKSFDIQNPTKVLAPIQSIIYADGTHSDDTRNLLSFFGRVSTMKLIWLKRNSEEVSVQIEYQGKRPSFILDGKVAPGGEEGMGYYRVTIRVLKNEKSILLEEDSNCDVQYHLGIQIGLNPDQARYRGWNAEYEVYGYETKGVVYRPENVRHTAIDATIDLSGNKIIQFPFLTLWEPAGGEQNTGRYWMLYNSQSSKMGNLLGFYQGRASKLIGARAVGIQFHQEEEKKKVANLFFSIERRGPDNSWFPRKKFEWRIFISNKNDLLPIEKTQPIFIDLNKFSGLGSKINTYRNKTAIIIPSFYSGSIYQDKSAIQSLIKQVKKDKSFFERLTSTEPYYADVFLAWRFPDSAKSLIKNLINYEKELVEQYQKGEGSYHATSRYWMGAINFKQTALKVSCLFADQEIIISQNDKNALERLIRLMARILWDDDNVPCQENSGVNYGPANMMYQYRNTARNFFALLFANAPEFEKRSNQVALDTKTDFEEVIYENGSSIAVPHYTQAALEPILFNMLQLKRANVVDLFKGNNRLYAFINFYKSLLTPPSVRFQGNRKLISFGDGTEESSVIFALIASGLSDSDKTVSEELYAIYNHGSPRMSLSGSVFLSIDTKFREKQALKVSSANFNGYMSHFRSGINTKNETAIWFFNGDKVYDHRNDDAGEVVMYALKAPLSLSRSSFYSPSASDARIRSVVVPGKLFRDWNAQAQSIDERSLTNRTWPNSFLNEFVQFDNVGMVNATMVRDKLLWMRKIIFISIEPERPMIFMNDSVSGNEDNIWSFMFMSAGVIKTPAGPITPIDRLHNNNDRKETPMATAEKTLKKGLNEFNFNGQKSLKNWHESGGIDWNLYLSSDTLSSFTLAQWTTTSQSDVELVEFRNANQKAYSETQQILRWKSKKPFFALILPYFKDTKPFEGKVFLNNHNEFTVNSERYQYKFSDKYVTVIGNDKHFLYALTEQVVEVGKFKIEGGACEIELTEKVTTIKVGGKSGNRKIEVEGKWKADKYYPGLAYKIIGNKTIIEIKFTSLSKNKLSTVDELKTYYFVKN